MRAINVLCISSVKICFNWEMNFEDSDEDDDIHLRFCYWNNWVPKANGNSKNISIPNAPYRKRINQGTLNNSHFNTYTRIQNWIPPNSFRKTNVRAELKSIAMKATESAVKEIKKNMNEDWGMRIDLHEVLNVTEDEKFWNIMKRGLFGND